MTNILSLEKKQTQPNFNPVFPNSLRHSWPKWLTLLVAVPVLPKEKEEILPYMLVGVSITLCLHTVATNKMAIRPLTFSDCWVITINLLITVSATVLFLQLINDEIQPVDSLLSTPAPFEQLLYILLWTISQELFFFPIHRFAHLPGIYDKCHKMHHKFSVTSAWTAFYAHPLDHLVTVICATLIAPLIHIAVLQHTVSVPTISLFMLAAVTTFIASHHTVKGSTNPTTPEGTPHLEHHMRSTVNFGNFGFLDKIFGSFYSSAKENGSLKITDEKNTQKPATMPDSQQHQAKIAHH